MGLSLENKINLEEILPSNTFKTRVPQVEVERKIKEGAIFAVNNKSGFSVNIKFRESKIYLGNMSHEMGYFLDNWGLIK